MNNKFTEHYQITECEHEGDIKYAINEVEKAGGIFDKVISVNKDNADEIDDYYESKEWFVQFHCNSLKDLENARNILGI